MRKFLKASSLTIISVLLGAQILSAADSLLKGTAVQLKPATLPTKGINGELRIDGSNVLKKYDTGAGAWQSIAGTVLGSFGSAPDDKGASVSGSTLTMQPADLTHPGEVSTATQFFGGTKIVPALGASAISSFAPTGQIEAGVSGGPANIYSTAYGSGQFTDFGGFIGRRALGTSGSPTAVTNGRTIATFGGAGYGDTGFAATSRGGMRVLGAETWTDSAQGTILHLQTTPTGSTTPATILAITAAGAASFTNSLSADSLSLTTALPIASGGTANGSLGVTAGGVTYGDGSKLMMSAAGASGQLLASNGASAPSFIAPPGRTNYLTNPDAEVDTTGWATYADAAATSPVDGTAGSPTLTFTRTTSTPLRGVGSFLITKDAANRQGNGSSYDFTIDVADKGKVLQISFDYTIASGTYADGDQTLWIYDVTNSALIQPAGTSIINTGTQGTHTATFQTASDSTSYRFIIHTASTSASAYTVKLDNVKIGPQIVTQGAAVSDWVSYTPSSNGLGTLASINVQWRRVGDSIEILGTLTIGTVTGSEARINFPSGLTIDTTKVTAATICGEITATGNGALYNSILSAAANNYFQISSTTSTSALTPANGNALFGNAQTLAIACIAPITGWSSNVELSQNTDTRVVNAIVTGDPASATVGNPIIVPTVGYDSHGAYSNSTGGYTVPVSGSYRVHGALLSASSATTLTVYKNAVSNSLAGNLDSNGEATFSTTVKCVAGDVLDLRPGGTVDATSMTINFERLSGPATIAASETVSARYYGSVTTISGSAATIVHDNKDWDTHNAYSAGTYTVPVSGRYQVNAAVLSSYTPAADSASIISINVNGTTVTQNIFDNPAVVTQSGINISDIIRVKAGDAVLVSSLNQNTTPTIQNGATTKKATFLSIVRVGNY